MSKPLAYALVLIAGLALGATAQNIYPLTWVGLGTELKAWQGLIAGLLAIAAAWIGVRGAMSVARYSAAENHLLEEARINRDRREVAYFVILQLDEVFTTLYLTRTAFGTRGPARITEASYYAIYSRNWPSIEVLKQDLSKTSILSSETREKLRLFVRIYSIHVNNMQMANGDGDSSGIDSMVTHANVLLYIECCQLAPKVIRSLEEDLGYPSISGPRPAQARILEIEGVDASALQHEPSMGI